MVHTGSVMGIKLEDGPMTLEDFLEVQHMPRQLPNEVGNSLGGLPHQNANSSVAQMQSTGGGLMEPDIIRARKYLSSKIFEFLMNRNPSKREGPTEKVMNIVKRLEDALFRTASSKDGYLNLETLENRMNLLVKRLPLIGQSQNVSHSSSVGTTMPTGPSGAIRSGFHNSSQGSVMGIKLEDHQMTLEDFLEAQHMSRQLPNQVGNSLGGLPQQNANSSVAQMQSRGGLMEPDIIRARKYLASKIIEFMMTRHPSNRNVPTEIVMKVVKRLEEGLFRTASSKEEYLNLETLENRLSLLIKRLPLMPQRIDNSIAASTVPSGAMRSASCNSSKGSTPHNRG